MDLDIYIRKKLKHYEDEKIGSHQDSILQVYYNYMYQLIFFLKREEKGIINMKKEKNLDKTLIKNQFFLSIIAFITFSFSVFETAIKDLYINKKHPNFEISPNSESKGIFDEYISRKKHLTFFGKKYKNTPLDEFSEMRNGIHDFGLTWPNIQLTKNKNLLMKIDLGITEGEKVILDIVRNENLENTKSPSIHYLKNFK